MTWEQFLFSVEGRVSRRQFWLWYYLPVCAALLFAVIFDVTADLFSEEAGIGFFSGILILILIWPSIAVNVKRLHDRNKSGWFYLIFLIPIVGIIWWFIDVGILKGTVGKNRFGPDPVTDYETSARSQNIDYAVAELGSEAVGSKPFREVGQPGMKPPEKNGDSAKATGTPLPTASDEIENAQSGEKLPSTKNGRTLTSPLEDMTQSNDKTSWSEEFQILNEYDTVVKECHDELEDLDPQLSRQFREKVVSDRKKAKDILGRLKTEFEKKRKALEAELEKARNPYTSDGLNEALSEARLLGPGAEKEFTRVVDVMGEDIEVDAIINRLKEKFGSFSVPKNRDAQLEYWGVIKIGDEFALGEFTYKNKDDPIAYAEKKLDQFLKKAQLSDLQGILISCGYKIKKTSDGKNRKFFHVTSKEGAPRTLMADEFPRFIKGKISPKEIRQCVDYLLA